MQETGTLKQLSDYLDRNRVLAYLGGKGITAIPYFQPEPGTLFIEGKPSYCITIEQFYQNTQEGLKLVPEVFTMKITEVSEYSAFRC